MISRFDYEEPKQRDSSHDDEMKKYSYEKRMKVLSKNKDGSVDKYIEENYWKEEKSSWSDYINSFNLGSPQEQMINHLTKGTPLVTAHTLPAGDYTKLMKGAEIRREMQEKGITLEMIIQALSEESSKVIEEKKEEKQDA